jgi:hypothetical protein
MSNPPVISIEKQKAWLIQYHQKWKIHIEYWSSSRLDLDQDWYQLHIKHGNMYFHCMCKFHHRVCLNYNLLATVRLLAMRWADIFNKDFYQIGACPILKRHKWKIGEMSSNIQFEAEIEEGWGLSVSYSELHWYFWGSTELSLYAEISSWGLMEWEIWAL